MAQVLFNILMDPELLAQVDKYAGPRKRCEWIRQACIMRLTIEEVTVKETEQDDTITESD